MVTQEGDSSGEAKENSKMIAPAPASVRAKEMISAIIEACGDKVSEINYQGIQIVFKNNLGKPPMLDQGLIAKMPKTEEEWLFYSVEDNQDENIKSKAPE